MTFRSSHLSKLLHYVLMAIFLLLGLFHANSGAYAEETAVDDGKTLAKVTLDGDGGGGSNTALPDLFTGTLSFSFPIEVPPGRKGMDPAIALGYRSSNGNGWLGVGWDLELGAIQRSTRNGVSYTGSDYQLRRQGATQDLINIGGEEYRAKIEGQFLKITKVEAGNYWIVTDKAGVRFFFGQTDLSRQDSPDHSKVFKWCLTRILDTNGNEINITYNKEQGQIYPHVVAYNNNIVMFNLEARPDVTDMYTTNFKVTTASRLGSIEVFAGTNLLKKYVLSYDDSSRATGRTLLRKITTLGRDGIQVLTFTSFEWLDDPRGWTNTAPISSEAFSAQNNAAYGYFDNDNFSTLRSADVNGDGFIDMCARHDSGLQCYLGNGHGWEYSAGYDSIATGQRIFANDANRGFGDFDTDNWPTLRFIDLNGDGKSDTCMRLDYGLLCYLSTGTGWQYAAGYDSYATGTTSGKWIYANGSNQYGFGTFDGDNTSTVQFGDLNGDAKADVCLRHDYGLQCFLSTGSGWDWENKSYDTYASRQFIFANGSDQKEFGKDYDTDNWPTIRLVDVTGDGKADACIRMDYGLLCYLSKKDATGFEYSATYDSYAAKTYVFSNWSDQHGYGTFNGDNSGTVQFMDLNGDGKNDACMRQDYGLQCFLSTGEGWVYAPGYDTFVTQQTIFKNGTYQYGYGNFDTDNISTIRYLDINGDAKSDVCIRLDSGIQCYLSTGSGWQYSSEFDTYNTHELIFSNGAVTGEEWRGVQYLGVKGDGRQLPCALKPSGMVCAAFPTDTPPQVDLLKLVKNGIGGTTEVSYTPSTGYDNLDLPFPVQTVSSIKVSDGNDNSTTTTYSYSGGFFYYSIPGGIADREFRGFNRVTVTGPPSSNTGERAITEMWFHQGNEVNPLPEAALIDELLAFSNVKDGYMKGKPYRIKKWKGSELISETTFTYHIDPQIPPTAPFFNGEKEVLTTSCSAGTCTKQTRTTKHYDAYGNVTIVYNEGDLSDSQDDLTIVTAYAYNTDNYIIGLPKTETVYKGLGTSDRISQVDYFFDGSPNCTASSTSQFPIQGNVTTIRRWNNRGNDIETWTGYDSYGNVRCSRDANGYTSIVSYDNTFTFPIVATDPLGHNIVTEYYGVNGVAADKGLYGQVKTVTDANGAVASFEYDVFGRKKVQIQPDGFTTTWEYRDSGIPNDQYVMTSNTLGQWSYSYYDGMNRVIREERLGPGGKTVVTTRKYYPEGTVYQQSLPYFRDEESPRYTTFEYDALGRVTRITKPDGFQSRTCYDTWTKVTLDENNHRKREGTDAFGRLVKIEEYSGAFSSCTTETGTPYATTNYTYDILGNLRRVVDTKGNTTEINYTSLNRKENMTDPDMGYWQYQYDGNGNLLTQTDAEGRVITFTYDQLNRIKTKDYPTGTDVTFTYDEPFSTNAKGRLTTMTDESGTSKYFYDKMGRTEVVVKSIDGVEYRTESTFANGRLHSIKYPDGDIVAYGYEPSGIVNNVGGYATYSGFNALGQPGFVSLRNGVTTSYTYSPVNNRLATIVTSRYGESSIVDLSYQYDNKGNVRSVADNANPASPPLFESQTYIPDASKPHAVGATEGGRTFAYDKNGNMKFDGFRTLTFNYDNMPKTVGDQVTFYYDGNGKRVKKVTPTGTTVYIDSLYECVNGSCAKYIYSGTRRIAMISGMETFYYHTDHLGSTVAVTEAAGNKVETIAYFPFGETRDDTGSAAMNHKYTSQELDHETGLYNYNARLYDPELGRFISADALVPDPENPQSFNRYSYVSNNPMMSIDPSGYWRISLSAHYLFGGHLSYDFDTGHFNGGVGIGIGAGFSVGDNNWDLGVASELYADYGYDNTVNSDYVTARVGYGYVSASGTYYTTGQYQFNVAAGYQGYGVNVGYSSFGGGNWSLGGNIGGIGSNYDFGSRSWHFSAFMSGKDAMEIYETETSSRETGNGYGASTSNPITKIFNKGLDLLGTVTAGAKAAEIHDTDYETPGISKRGADGRLFLNMAKGAISNISGGYGLMRAGIGLAISPVYYAAVMGFGGSAYKMGQFNYGPPSPF